MNNTKSFFLPAILFYIKINPVSNTRKKTLGVVFVILVNIIYVAQNYLVKTVELGAGEVSLVRGLLQMTKILEWKIVKMRSWKVVRCF